MKLVIALGNPGAEYKNTRHNLGWRVLDEYLGSVNWSEKFGGLYYKKGDIIFVKPQKFYNLTGEVAQQFKHFYKIKNSDILVIYDELDLPFGKIRVRLGGSAAGNNGVKSLISNLGDDFWRLRIGSQCFKKPLLEKVLPNYKTDKTKIVLGKITREEAEILAKIQPEIAEKIGEFLR